MTIPDTFFVAEMEKKLNAYGNSRKPQQPKQF